MAPKKPVKGVKKEEANPEPPKASTLPDGDKSHWIGGWSAYQSLAALQALTQPEIGCSLVRVLPGTITETEDGADVEAKVIVCGAINIVGQLPSITAASKAAWEQKRAPKAAGGEGEEGNEDAGGAEGGDGAAEEEAAAEGEGGDEVNKAPKRPAPLLLDDAVRIKGNIVLEGLKPPVEVKIADADAGKKAAPVVAKGKGKRGDDEAAKAKEAEAQREREEAARQAAEAEVQRLSKYAMPSKFPAISISNLCFEGRLAIKGAHVTFRNCHFCAGPDHQVLVHQYCKVVFEKCSFSNVARTGIYCYPLSEVTATGCAFSGIAQPRSLAEIAAAENSPKAKKELDAAKARAQLNTSSVGVYADDAQLTVSQSVFAHLTTGIVLSGKCALSNVSGNFLESIFSTALYCDGSAAAIKNNQIDTCGYYGIQFVNRCSGKVMFNNIASTVQIGRGAHPLLHTNTLTVKLVDHNDVGNAALEPRY